MVGGDAGFLMQLGRGAQLIEINEIYQGKRRRMTGGTGVGMVAAQGSLNRFLPKFVATYPMNDRGSAIFQTWSHANVINTGRLE
ncbi:MAG: hypothetical protein WBO29_02775 [Albidovulum sp.]